MSKKPIEIIKNYDFKPSQIYEKDGGLFATIQENIISQIVEARDEEYYNFLIKQIRDFIVKNNIETCFVINKEELIDCLQEHNELHCKINNLQSQLDQANEKIMWLNAEIDALKSEKENLMRTLEEASEELEGAIVLPAKVGDTIYVVPSETNYRLNIVNGREEQNKVYEWTVSEIRYNKHGYSVVCDVGDAQFYCNYEPPKNLCGHFDTEKYYGETWFTTRAEAQAKLKEIQGNE